MIARMSRAGMAERASTESIPFTASVPKAGRERCAITVSFQFLIIQLLINMNTF